MTESTEAAARELLRRITGDDSAEPRVGQLEAIGALVDGRERVLVVQRTGWGKSAVYFIATRLMRDRGAGASLLISPLLALMRNQLAMAARAGVNAETINSENRDDWTAIEERVRAGEIDLLLVSPERLNNPRFRSDVLPHMVDKVGMLIVDEAHCISDWGHDFRPDYRRVAGVLDLLPTGVPVLCTTATANQRVVDDIVGQLGDDLRVLRGPLDRESLALGVEVMPSAARRLAWLAEAIPALDGTGIVYCLTVRDTVIVADWLRSRGIVAAAYSGESDVEHRLAVEAAFEANELKVVVATSALGMGYDKPDVAFVIHFQSPGSPIAYYQQVGRAGRSIDHSRGVLLVGDEDTNIQDFFIKTAFPSEEHATAVLDLLAAQSRPMSTRAVLEHVNVRQTRLEAMLKILEVEGAVERIPSQGWIRTAVPWAYDGERVERVTAARRAEQAAMFDYIRGDRCRMQMLLAELDDPLAEPCGRCDVCTGSGSDISLAPELVREALAFLRSRPLVIEPRLQWGGGIAELPHRIPAGEQLERGRALAIYGDDGWGSVVRDAKSDGSAIPDEMIDALADLVRQMAVEPQPTWVTWVPSTSSTVVHDVAARLADRLGVDAVNCVSRARAARPQNEMENSAQQLSNVYGAFAVSDQVRPGPVILLDDIVDSRWTLTVVGSALRRAGSGPVYPVALAKAEGG